MLEFTRDKVDETISLGRNFLENFTQSYGQLYTYGNPNKQIERDFQLILERVSSETLRKIDILVQFLNQDFYEHDEQYSKYTEIIEKISINENDIPKEIKSINPNPLIDHTGEQIAKIVESFSSLREEECINIINLTTYLLYCKQKKIETEVIKLFQSLTDRL
ncbi:hypothetical protein [Synechocystis sp. CACIAM 05]|uniref:hypothetical protein n=1 Tax=Synechocystis sp. CACIAM 05 TaxID=1933929 RepID=UPI00138E64B0|nr:hypothetical protein [Synechocystis sp. CACIAM 05]QHV01326.1 hypothetical protein BWK47_15095 [Synechocystis sp. CACIAM 05]